MIKKLFAISTMLVMILSFAVITKAQDAEVGITISPPVEEREVTPGENYTGKIKVTNNSSENLTLETQVQDFLAQGEEGGKTFIDPSDDNAVYSLAKWVKIEKDFSLNKGETKEISYTIEVPETAEPGGHYGVVFFSPKSSSAAVNGSGAVVQPKIGTLLLVTVKGDIRYGAKVAEFSTDKNLYTNSLNQIDFTTRFQNLSTIHVKPTGTIEIKNVLGSSVGSLAVNESGNNVLPDSIRAFSNQWEKKYGFGPYKATLNLTYGDGEVVTEVMTFWIIPWKETLAIALGIVLIVWIVSRLQWRKAS